MDLRHHGGWPVLNLQALGVIHPETQYRYMCEPVKHKKQVICSENTMIGQA